MSVITVLFVLALLGVLTWAITNYIPMPSAIKNLIIVVAVIVGILYVMQIFGVHLPHVPSAK